ncbi:DUF5342 family protein [Niallia sp. XMNu-256]|uniref:DUF5342 family protein n=1 Tax=Niallia sp. XMNu-256 TaxID=3082444 RepID=UPI0030D0E251
MFNNFEIEKTMFEGQVHERYQFVINCEECIYKGLYHNNGDITWFHPQPQNDMAEEYLIDIEKKVHEKMQDPFSLVNNFNIEKKMFEGQIHERYQFSFSYEENQYKGIYHDGDISWFHPHPLNDLEKENLTNIEEEVHIKLQN